jgi:hypothetical protein
MSANSEIGLSRKQRVFVALEATTGTLEWPSATQDYIRPAGNATINQTPAFVDSEELSSTLDLLDQFQNALPAGAWEIPMYLRPSGTIGGRPQGYDLLKSLQGDVNAATTGLLKGAITIAATTIVVDTVAGGALPHSGVITVGTEKLRYTGYTAAGTSQATLTGITRGWGSTTATNHADDAAFTLNSLVFKQAVTQPSLTIWVETDHFVQALSGATVNRAVFGVSNEGAVKLTCSGQGMQMYWAGTSALAAGASAAATQLTVANAKLFKAGMRIYNKTKNLTNTNAGWKINAVDTGSNLLRIDAATGVTWATGDLVAGFLPTGTTIGDPIEGRDTTVYLGGVTAKLKTMDLTLDLPKKYIEDEIGVEAPEDYIEDRRTISSALSLYFRRSDAKYFKDGYDGSEQPILITFGVDDGYIMDIYMPRCILEVPAINFAPPAVELNIPFRALGTAGEDSCEIIFN